MQATASSTANCAEFWLFWTSQKQPGGLSIEIVSLPSQFLHLQQTKKDFKLWTVYSRTLEQKNIYIFWSAAAITLQKAIPEANQRWFWLQNQWPCSWCRAQHCLGWLDGQAVPSRNKGVSILLQLLWVATSLLQENVMHSLLYWLGSRVKNVFKFILCKFEPWKLFFLHGKWNFNELGTDQHRAHCFQSSMGLWVKKGMNWILLKATNLHSSWQPVQERASTATTYALCYWLTLHNLILKFCPKFQPSNYDNFL